MHERFSDRARHAMALANLEATRFNHNFLAPAHLMLGLIAEGECVATAALETLNVNLEMIRDRVRSALAERSGADTSVGLRAQTKEMKQVVAASIERRRSFGHRYVGTEHLMLGLLRVPEGIPYRILRDAGVDLDSVREKAMGLLREPGDDDQPGPSAGRGDFEWVHQQELAKAFRSPTFWHTLILAVDSANRLGAGEVEPRHLLMALLRDKSNGISEVLAKKGVTAEWLHGQLNAQG